MWEVTFPVPGAVIVASLVLAVLTCYIFLCM